MPAVLSPSGRSVVISGNRGLWSERVPVERIASKLMLYRRLRDRADGKHSASYAATVDSLEVAVGEVARRLSIWEVTP